LLRHWARASLPRCARRPRGGRVAEGIGEPGAKSPVASAPGASAATAGKAGGEDEHWLYRHGVEIKLQGSYADMVGYLRAIENLPRRVHWGALAIDARRYPASVLTVTLYTVSSERSWWVL
jgi:MSHA biogenesis protein MshJ